MYYIEFNRASTGKWTRVGGVGGSGENLANLTAAALTRRKRSNGNRSRPYRIVDDSGIVVRYWPPYDEQPEWNGEDLGPFAAPVPAAVAAGLPPAGGFSNTSDALAYAREQERLRREGAGLSPTFVLDESALIPTVGGSDAPVVVEEFYGPPRVTPSPKFPTKKALRESLLGFPPLVRNAMEDVAGDPSMNEVMGMVMAREEEFSSPTAAMLAGIALEPRARAYVEGAMDEHFRDSASLPAGTDTIVVGAGLHAAIFCAVRAARGKARPFVLERKSNVGGVLAVSRKPSFFLNSRNRPGDLSIPGRMGALNFLPGAPVQPSDIGGNEFQANDEIAWVIRTTLAMHANVVTEIEVEKLGRTSSGEFNVRYNGGSVVKTPNPIIATGLGQPLTFQNSKGPNVLTFEEFMARMDDPYPLRGMRRVAVVGAGDSGKTAIEALTGRGPSRGLSVAALDFPREIDWYGVKQLNCVDWTTANRTRYKGIAGLLPNPAVPDREPRVRPIANKVGSVSSSFGMAYVDEKPYDMVIVCIGYNTRAKGSYGLGLEYNFEFFGDGGRSLAARARFGEIAGVPKVGDIWIIGPASEMPLSALEQNQSYASVTENGTALFRYASRTAALAAVLP